MIDDLILKFPNLDFSKFIYKSARSKSIVICKTHGEFETSRFYLLKAKYGCRECGKEYSNMSKRKNIENYIKINRNDDNYKDEIMSKRKYFKSADEYHKYKLEECSKLYIELIYINEEDWINDKDNILNNIKNKIERRI